MNARENIKKGTREGLADYLRSFEHERAIVVNEKYKFIYMKATKTAGSSILREGFDKHIEGTFHKKDQPKKFDAWLTAITDECLEDYYIFSVSRNPFTRFVSLAAYFNYSVKALVKNFYKYRKKRVFYFHSLPISLYTHINDERFVDYICKFENLQEDIHVVCNALEIPTWELSHVNKSVHNGLADLQDEKHIEFIRTVYKDDFKNFSYSETVS